MPNTFIDISTLSDAIENGWAILTPNHRTAVQVHENYGAYSKIQSGIRVRPSPNISPVDIWLKELSQQLLLEEDSLDKRTVLDSYQELTLWKKIISESEISSPLLSLENAAPSVLEAYRLITQWQISLKSLEAYQSKIESSEYTDDCTAFLQWAKQYQQYCRREKLINFSELIQSILPYIESDLLDLPEKIILLGFTNPPPLYQALFEKLNNKVSLQMLQWQKMQPEIYKQSYDDELSEIKAAAKWSKTILETTPDATIGIISNSIHHQHSAFQCEFQTIFDSQIHLDSPYFISTTNNFSKEYPLLLEIPELLKFNNEEIPANELCQILRSPLLHAQEEENARAALEYYLRNNSQTFVRSADLRALLANEKKDWHSPLLAEALNNCESLRRRQSHSQNLNAWAEFFTKQLELLAWPSKKQSELQQVQQGNQQIESNQENDFLISCWHQVLADFKQLNFLYRSLSFSQALAILKQLIQNFKHNENRQEAAIQISSSSDAAGLRFTHLWFLGLTDLQWPLNKYSNPFIPLALQRKLNIPESSPKLIYEAALDILSEFVTNTAKEVVLSYPRANTSGELNPTPMISLIKAEKEIENKHFGSSSLQIHPFSLKISEDSSNDEVIEIIEEPISIFVEDSEIIKGGISLITNQSECPFKAFAIHRLKAHELSEFTYGIPQKDIGTMIHLVLEQLWDKLKIQSALSSLPESKLKQTIETSCDAGIEYLRKRHKNFMQPTYASLEKQRLIKLITKWLEQEKIRAPFEVVAQEFKVQWQHASLKLDFKIDRIDKIEKGFALVDYKSGSVKAEVSDEARPSSPQLLLYASALAQTDEFNPVNALLYAQVNIDSPSYHGVSLDNATFPKTGYSEQRKIAVDYSWDELKQHWQHVLSNIAQEFLDGYVAVDPKGPMSCHYCHLSSFCRIQEQNQELSNSYE